MLAAEDAKGSKGCAAGTGRYQAQERGPALGLNTSPAFDIRGGTSQDITDRIKRRPLVPLVPEVTDNAGIDSDTVSIDLNDAPRSPGIAWWLTTGRSGLVGHDE